MYNNKSLSTQSVTKQQLLKHQVDQNLTHRLDFESECQKPKRGETGSLSKSKRQTLQRLHTQDKTIFGSVRNLSNAGYLSVSKVRQYLHSKTSYTKFSSAKQKFKRRKAFKRFKLEIWCMDLPLLINCKKVMV